MTTEEQKRIVSEIVRNGIENGFAVKNARDLLLIDFGRLKKDFLIPCDPGHNACNHFMVNIGSAIVAMIEDYAIEYQLSDGELPDSTDSQYFEAFIHYVEFCQSIWHDVHRETGEEEAKQ